MKNADKPAFPVEADKLGTTNGISKREYFAAMAMQALLSRNSPIIGDVAASAVRYADILLKQLETK